MRPTANQFLLPMCATCSELVFNVELYNLQQISFQCRIVWPTMNQFHCQFSTINPSGRNGLNVLERETLVIVRENSLAFAGVD